MGRKALKRKLGKKVLAGTMTVTEARARLGRDMVRKSYGAAWSTWPVQGAGWLPGREDEWLRAAVSAPVPQPAPPVIRKARRTAADKQYDRQMAPVRELIAKASGSVTASPLPPRPPGPVVKQLSQPERATVAELRREFARAAHDPVRREAIRTQITRITGEIFIT